ncbi:hypothetical protein [Nocardiopsis ganjiahuensis]|uniref:hypothetical protein n=1 Tax=Nocardiopsis ganjiahuensis TaxID=239984 RepID=UPI0003462553|nr:hypothetical protein [Nocardiopsis ganjiahuensis]
MAAFVGVAATGVAVARAERQRRAYTPEQVRERLHARVAEVARAENGLAADGDPVEEGAGGEPSRGLVRRVRAGLSRVGALPPVATIGRLLRRARGADAAER